MPSLIGKEKIINFAKRAKTADTIREIQLYQTVGYSLQMVPELQDYILSTILAVADDHELYGRSLTIEPRPGDRMRGTEI